MTIHKISKITKKLQLTGPTSQSRSAHNERSLQRLWGYTIIVFNVWKFEIQTQETRTKPLSSYYWQWPPVLFSFLSIGMNSFQKAQAEARGPSPVPELFIWKLMIWGEVQKTQDIEMPKTPNKIVKKICHLWCSRSRCSTVVGSCCTTASGRWRCSRGFWYKYFFVIW